MGGGGIAGGTGVVGLLGMCSRNGLLGLYRKGLVIICGGAGAGTGALGCAAMLWSVVPVVSSRSVEALRRSGTVGGVRCVWCESAPCKQQSAL